MTDVRRIAKNSVIQAAAFVAQGLTELTIALVLARLAGAERLGEFTTLVMLAGLFSCVSAFGLPGLLTREIARLRDDREQILPLVNAAVGLVSVLSVVAIALMVAIGMASGYSPVLLRAITLTAMALAIESMTLVMAAAFRGLETLQWSSAISVVMDVGFLLLATAAVALGARTDLLMAIYLVSRVIAFVAAVWLYRVHFGTVRPVADRRLWHKLLSTGLPFSVNSLFSFAYSRLDVVILSYMAGNTAVGFYEVAYSLTMRMNIVARALTLALYPFLSSQFVKDKQSMRFYTARGLSFLIIPGFFIATTLWVFGRDLLSVVYGPAFAEAASLAVKVLAFAVPLRFIETMLAVSLDARDWSGRRATAVAIAGTTNALLNFILIPHYQMMGAVYSTLLTEVVICGLFVWYLRKEIGEIIQLRAFVGPGLGALLILVGTLVFGIEHVWLSMMLSILVYVAAIVVTDPSSIRPLRQMARRRELFD